MLGPLILSLAKFFWLLGRLGLGVRSWVHIGLGVRLGLVFSFIHTSKLLPYE